MSQNAKKALDTGRITYRQYLNLIANQPQRKRAPIWFN